MLNQVSVGDEIVTAGGMYGEVTAVDEDDVRVRIAPELEVRIARRAISVATVAIIGPRLRLAQQALHVVQPQRSPQPDPIPSRFTSWSTARTW